MRPSGEPEVSVLFRCLARSYLVGANFNTRGMQNIGLSYAMDPGLVAIHVQGKDLYDARRRYLRHYNTHPFWTPLLIGIFLSLEIKIAKNQLPPGTLENVRQTTIYTLSAIGDSVFGGGVLVLWALATACMIVTGHGVAAVLTGGVLLLSLQAFKALTFFAGLREGFRFLPRLKRFNLINWGRRIKLVNALLTVLFWYLVWPEPVRWTGWLLGVGALCLATWLVLKTRLSRGLALIFLLAGYAVAPFVLRWLETL
ncbi:PTS system IID component, Man family [Desulfocurvibacter africanus PCS]|uniref:PTS system IID component, Man family n=1 Tax=Desulfocurvibacter africanus PCS TaxID=1262666 RepID=M5PZP1_DESAF|nr:PTS system mannose/fructose/sorbose family transporter subunit IID [Desulfocurvibacter africanus]EMG36016.1 PTS system IID component, Man family [Desulfocurvibacter africanus PCS]